MATKFVLVLLSLLIAKSYQKDVEVVAASEQGTESLDEKLKWSQSLCEVEFTRIQCTAGERY